MRNFSSLEDIIIVLFVTLIFFTLFFGNVFILGMPLRLSYLIILYFLFMLVYKLDTRISILLGVAFLVVAAFFLLATKETQAEWSAQTAYGFLVIGVFLQIIEFFTSQASSKKSSAKIQILSDNGIPGEASRVSSFLKEKGFNLVAATNADHLEYRETILHFKPDFEGVANLLAQEIEAAYPPVLRPDLPASSQADIVLILGWTKR